MNQPTHTDISTVSLGEKRWVQILYVSTDPFSDVLVLPAGSQAELQRQGVSYPERRALCRVELPWRHSGRDAEGCDRRPAGSGASTCRNPIRLPRFQ